MQIRLVTAKLTTTHLTEGDTRTMVGIDIGCNLEDKARKLRFFGLHVALLGLRRTRRWGDLHKAVQQFLYTEIVQSRTKEHGCHFSVSICLNVEFGIDAIDEFQVLTQFLSILLPYPLVEFRAVDIHLHLLRHALLIGSEEVKFLLIDIIHALELRTLIDGPRQGTHADLQFLFEFVKQVKGITPLTVHLVDEDDDGCLPHAADGHQFPGLCLHTLRAIHDDDR